VRLTTSIVFQCLENGFAIHDFAKSLPLERAALPEKIGHRAGNPPTRETVAEPATLQPLERHPLFTTRSLHSLE
jgi:hypothetical protein